MHTIVIVLFKVVCKLGPGLSRKKLSLSVPLLHTEEKEIVVWMYEKKKLYIWCSAKNADGLSPSLTCDNNNVQFSMDFFCVHLRLFHLHIYHVIADAIQAVVSLWLFFLVLNVEHNCEVSPFSPTNCYLHLSFISLYFVNYPHQVLFFFTAHYTVFRIVAYKRPLSYPLCLIVSHSNNVQFTLTMTFQALNCCGM